ncbi:hypothetical protein DM860_001576 [Cuscuta australis]|uniref:Uncharacterized protein n=1 Tax=Cuscuta australis TaxID=267555 RepID=A0A328ECQ3_9ASTE|nr:hypothetical protein DM860_001576 [Cuscuta australis]
MDGDSSKESTADMTQFVQSLLQQMCCQHSLLAIFGCYKSDRISNTAIISLIPEGVFVLDNVALDEMGERINELEQSINELRGEMGQDGSPSPSPALKTKEEPNATNESE